MPCAVAYSTINKPSVMSAALALALGCRAGDLTQTGAKQTPPLTTRNVEGVAAFVLVHANGARHLVISV